MIRATGGAVERLPARGTLSTKCDCGRRPGRVPAATGPAALLAILIPGLIAIDLFSLAYPLSEQAFILPINDVQIEPAPKPIAFTTNTYEKRLNGIDYTRSYLPILAGYGTLNYCTPLSPPASVITAEEKEKDSNIISTSDSSKGTAQLISWSPNTIQVNANISQQADLFINTNYAKGWRMNGRPATELSNRVGATLQPGTHHLIFRYHTPGFPLGLTITTATLSLLVLLSFRKPKVS